MVRNLGAALGIRLKGEGFSPLINHRCVLGATRNEPISVSFLIPFESQVRLDGGAFLFRWSRQSFTDGSAQADHLQE